MPEILILSGIPNSGKSTFAKYKKEIDGTYTLSRDYHRYVMGGGKYIFDSRLEDRVTTVYDKLYKDITSRGCDLILDNTHCKSSYLDAEIKRKPEGYTLRVIFFDIPLWKAYIRNILRWIKTGKYIPVSVIKNMKKNYDKIDKKKYDLVYE